MKHYSPAPSVVAGLFVFLGGAGGGDIFCLACSGAGTEIVGSIGSRSFRALRSAANQPKLDLVNIFVICFLLITVSGCATSVTRVSRFSIKPWSEELEKRQPYKYPFVAFYKNSAESLAFMAARHSNKIDSPSFLTVAKLLERQKFDLLVVEGVPRSRGINPKDYIASAVADGEGGFYRGEERNFTIQKALSNHIPFIGGEPDDTDIAREIERRGYSHYDLIFTYLVRQIPQWRRRKQLNASNVIELSERFIKNLAEELSLGKEPSFKEFEVWYKAKNQNAFRADDINTETAAPYKNGALFTQRLASAVEMVRDEFIVNTVAAELKNYPRIMIIYGGSHWATQSDAWEAHLGKPEFEKLFSE